MACLKCGSAWVTQGKGRDMASCPQCCEQQRCKARKQGRLPPVPANCEKTCADCGCVYTVSYPRGSRSKVCGPCKSQAEKIRRTPEAVKLRRMCRMVSAFLADAQAAMRLQQQASVIATARTNNPPRPCVMCKAPFRQDKRRGNETCSAECARKVVFRMTCACCGVAVDVGVYGRDARKRRMSAMCKKCKAKAWRKTPAGKVCSSSEHRKRCRRHGVRYDSSVKPAGVFQRDGHRCHVCKRKTLKAFAWVDGKPHPRSPTIDHHPYPLSAGVCGHEWHNVRCCCWECNTKKGAKWDGQLPIKEVIETVA